jgi:hypothetical protein
VELKLGSFKPEYKSQMELYLRWLSQNEQEPGENLPLGIILCAGKNTEQIELLELGAAGIHVAEYLTVLPPPNVLRVKLRQAIEVARPRIQSREEENMRELQRKITHKNTNGDPAQPCDTPSFFLQHPFQGLNFTLGRSSRSALA